jgi:hypothetical protein
MQNVQIAILPDPPGVQKCRRRGFQGFSPPNPKTPWFSPVRAPRLTFSAKNGQKWHFQPKIEKCSLDFGHFCHTFAALKSHCFSTDNELMNSAPCADF